MKKMMYQSINEWKVSGIVCKDIKFNDAHTVCRFRLCISAGRNTQGENVNRFEDMVSFVNKETGNIVGEEFIQPKAKVIVTCRPGLNTHGETPRNENIVKGIVANEQVEVEVEDEGDLPE